MGKLFKNSWALFAGYGVIIIAHGLQGNLLGVRAVIENFNFIATGAMMSGYFIGYFTGANFVPNLVAKVGHIRVFAAFASIASLGSRCSKLCGSEETTRSEPPIFAAALANNSGELPRSAAVSFEQETTTWARPSPARRCKTTTRLKLT